MFSFFPPNDREQRLRIKRFLMACGAYLIWGVLCLIAYAMGLTKVPLIILVAGFSANFIVNFIFYIIFRTGLNKKFNDPSLTLLQMLIATFWTMVVVYYAYEARSAVLLVYMVVLVFGFFRLRILQFLFLSVFALVNYSAVIFILYKTNPEFLNTTVDIFNIVVLACILPWFAVIGGYITNLRAKVSNSLSTIKQMTDNILDVIFVLDMNLKYSYVSPSVKILRGYEPEEILKQSPAEALTPSSYQLATKTFAEIMELRRLGVKVPASKTLKLEFTRKDGGTVWTETKFSFIKDKNNQPMGILCVIRDDTERRQMEEALRKSEELYTKLVDTIPDIVTRTDLNGNLLFVNNYGLNVTGYTWEEMEGQNMLQFVAPEYHNKAMENTLIILGGGMIGPQEYELLRKDGRRIPFEVNGDVLRDEEGKPFGVVRICRDITERKIAEEALRKSEQIYQELSIVDGLTQLYNSRHFYDQLKKEIDRSNRYNQPLTLILMDIDKFKDFNDAYGHIQGDYVLSRLGQVIKRCLRETDSAYRYGGEEFTILLPMTISEDGLATAKRIREELRKESFSPVPDKKIYMTVSIGLAQYLLKEEMKEFVHRVDQLMYQAKKNGRDRICPEL